MADGQLPGDVVRAGKTFLRLAAELEEEVGLRIRLEDVHDEAAIETAYKLLESDAPLQGRYKNGDRAIPPFTPRQVLTLTERPPITHEQREYAEALEKIQEELGRYEPRKCKGTTKDGRLCASWALPYSDDPLCSAHNSPFMQQHNNKMREEEERRLHAELERLGWIA